MKLKVKKTLQIILAILIVIIVLYIAVSQREYPVKPIYGVSFNTLYAQELGLNWKVVYDAVINELKPHKIRLAAHWDLVEPEKDVFNFEEIDYQIEQASAADVQIVLAVGKRLPRWPECHLPEWAMKLSKEGQEKEILEYIETVVRRYKDNEHIKIWQVENEAFLSIFAKEHCKYFDEDFLDKEIALVKELDSKRPILITDSGELSTWRKAYKRGDVFGTTLYVYAWNKVMGEFRNLVLPGFYAAKSNIWDFFYGEKEVIIAELSLEPWLNKPIIEEKIEIQIKRMSPKKFENVLDFAKDTGFTTQYLWGAEWWYYMKLQGEDWYWEKGKEIFAK
jgi:hypothetical protein